MNNNSNRHSVLLEQISYWAKKVGRASARPVLLLWFVMTSSNTPKSEKIMLASAIAYVVLPIDLISAKRIPIIVYGIHTLHRGYGLTKTGFSSKTKSFFDRSPEILFLI